MELKEIKELIELVAEKGFSEFELQKGGFRLRICLDSSTTNELVAQPLPKPKVAQVVTPVADLAEKSPVLPTVSAAPPAVETKVNKDLYKLKAPIVGTFYRSPSPTAEPFVRNGSKVANGSVLCIIEAMKLMNEIEADVTGEIVEIYVENGQPVEYGQPLFGIQVD